MATRKPITHIYKDGSVFNPRLPKPTRLTPQQLEEKGEKGLCYNFDRKYTKSALRINYVTYIVKRRKKRNKKIQKKRIYTRSQP